MEKVNLPECSKGDWEIKIVVTDRVSWHDEMMGRHIPLGEKITVLTRGDTLVMSDTPAEMRDHYEAVRQAKGSCLINGLGIGMVLKNILLNPDVTDVTVVEISQDLIDLVAPHYVDQRLTIVCADAFAYKPPKGKVYDMVWHDIFDTICADNLEDMKRLHRKYARCSRWQGSWCRAECRHQAKSW